MMIGAHRMTRPAVDEKNSVKKLRFTQLISVTNLPVRATIVKFNSRCRM